MNSRPRLKVLVACEVTGTVRDEFNRRGHSAISCDILPSLKPGPHILGSILDVDSSRFDMMIAFPPCTYLCISGARWWAGRQPEQKEAVEFFKWFTRAKIPWAIENPIGIMSRLYRKPDQIIQPWQFGHGETKATCLWLNRLPKLLPSLVVSGRERAGFIGCHQDPIEARFGA